MSTTGAGVSSTQADLLIVALSKTGRFIAEPVAHGLAVRVETVQRNAKGSAPLATSTIWLPDNDDGIGWAWIGWEWTNPIDHEMPADASLEQVVAAIIATLLPGAVQP